MSHPEKSQNSTVQTPERSRKRGAAMAVIGGAAAVAAGIGAAVAFGGGNASPEKPVPSVSHEAVDPGQKMREQAAAELFSGKVISIKDLRKPIREKGAPPKVINREGEWVRNERDQVRVTFDLHKDPTVTRIVKEEHEVQFPGRVCRA